jgi:hypothetical protein
MFKKKPPTKRDTPDPLLSLKPMKVQSTTEMNGATSWWSKVQTFMKQITKPPDSREI